MLLLLHLSRLLLLLLLMLLLLLLLLGHSKARTLHAAYASRIQPHSQGADDDAVAHGASRRHSILMYHMLRARTHLRDSAVESMLNPCSREAWADTKSQWAALTDDERQHYSDLAVCESFASQSALDSVLPAQYTSSDCNAVACEPPSATSPFAGWSELPLLHIVRASISVELARVFGCHWYCLSITRWLVSFQKSV